MGVVWTSLSDVTICGGFVFFEMSGLQMRLIRFRIPINLKNPHVIRTFFLAKPHISQTPGFFTDSCFGVLRHGGLI